jgi:hypothetical protein
MAAYIFDPFPAAVRAMAARCKLPFAIRPGLTQEDRRRTNEITNEMRKTFSLFFRGCHKGGRGEEQGFLGLGAQPLSLCSPLLFSLSPLPEFPPGFPIVRPARQSYRRLARSPVQGRDFVD